MNEQEFKTHYIATFLASYMASRYDNDCLTGHINEPYDTQPIEDAAFLADCAWGLVCKAKINLSNAYGKIGVEE